MITAVTIALIAVLVLLVGLPLAAVWWSRRAFWSRLRPGRDRDAWGDVMRAHGLTPEQMARVEAAVFRGRRLEDPRERAAVVDLARFGQPRWEQGSRAASWWIAAAIGWGCVTVAAAVYATVAGRWDDLPWEGLVWVLPLWWFSGNPQRAIRRNRD